MKVQFWGTRGSIAAPLRSGEIRDKLCRAIANLPETLNVRDAAAVQAYVAALPPLRQGTAGGNTACVAVRSGEDWLALDAGTGLRELGLALMGGPFGQGKGTLHLLISHPHWDHIQGFPMFMPAFIPGNRIRIYGFHDLQKAFETQQQFLTWPISFQAMAAQIEFVPLRLEQSLRIGGVQVSALENQHPGNSYSYRLSDGRGTLVYATDMEHKQLDDGAVQQYVRFFQQADVMVFDSQYTLRESWQKEDWGHSSALIGVDLARAAGVKKLLLFHHDPTYSDVELEQILTNTVTYQAQNPGRPTCEIGLAYEGLELDLGPERAIDWRRVPDGRWAILTSARVFDELSVVMVEHQLEGTDTGSIIDLSQVETLTTGGIKALVTLQQRQPGRALALVASSERVGEVIRLAGCQDLFAVYPTVEAALAAVAAREAARLPGQVLGGRYQIEARLGENALGTKLRVLDLETQERCLLRLLALTLSPETIARLLQQASRVIGLEHPAIARVRAWEQQGELVYAVEALPEAPTLDTQLAAGRPLSGGALLSLILDLSRALEYAHSRGIIHGDLRPANIYLPAEGARIGGFGVGRLMEGRNLREAAIWLQDPAYLAPEQILGQPVDARTDLYGLGVILYQAATGQLPFAGTPEEILEGHLFRAPLRPGALNPALSPVLEHLILKLLAKTPNERYASAQPVRRIAAGLSVREGPGGLRRRLVAREEPLRVLRSGWERARNGEGQLIFISGESGIGKTALAYQAAGLSGAEILLGGAGEEREGAAAYSLFTQILRAYLRTDPPELREPVIRHLLGNFLGLIPELAAMVPDVTPPPPLGPKQEPLRLMASLIRLIQRATRERPWFVILDDLQWAERGSLEMLRYLGRHLKSTRLLLVGIYHDFELGPDHPLGEVVQALRQDPGYAALVLNRLDERAVGALLENFWEQPVPADFTAKLYQYTAGNPFYVEEAVKMLADEGHITLKDGRWHFPTNLDRVILPASVQEVMLYRVELLPEATQMLLRQAVVLGPSFRYPELREMSGLAEAELLERLDPALERQLVLEMPGRDLLQFRQFEIQQVLYGSLRPLRRRLLHRQAGEALERLRTGGAELPVAALAHHFGEAGESEKAIRYGIETARQAHRAYALDTARLWYERTLARVRYWPEEAPALELELHRGLSQAFTSSGEYEAALAHCVAAWDRLAAQPEGTEAGRLRAELCYLFADIYEGRGEYDPALEWIEKGLAHLEGAAPGPELARLYFLRGWIHVRRGQSQAAQEQLETALKLAQAEAGGPGGAEWVQRPGSTPWLLQDPEPVWRYAERCLEFWKDLS